MYCFLISPSKIIGEDWNPVYGLRIPKHTIYRWKHTPANQFLSSFLTIIFFLPPFLKEKSKKNWPPFSKFSPNWNLFDCFHFLPNLFSHYHFFGWGEREGRTDYWLMFYLFHGKYETSVQDQKNPSANWTPW